MPQPRKLRAVPDREFFDPRVKTADLVRRYRVSRYVIYRERRLRISQRDLLVVQRHQVKPEYLENI